MGRRATAYIFRGFYYTEAGSPPKVKLCPVEKGPEYAALMLQQHLGKIAELKASGMIPDGASPNQVLTGKVQPRTEPSQESKEGIFSLPRKKIPSLPEAIEAFLIKYRANEQPYTYRYYKNNLAILARFFQGKPLLSFTGNDALTYKDYLKNHHQWKKGKVTIVGLGNTSANHCIICARALFNWAADEERGYIPKNPWKRVELFTQEPRTRLITEGEFSSLLREAPLHLQEILKFLRWTGCRPTELRQLRWSNVDWDCHCARLRPRRVKTKTFRVIPLTEATEKLLIRRKKRVKPDEEDFIFLNLHGRQWSADRLCQIFQNLMRRCVKKGLVRKEVDGERLVLYSARHSRLTEMLKDDIDLSIVAKVAGHSNVTTTAKHYLHLSDQDIVEAVRKKS